MSPENKDAVSQVYGEIVYDTATQTTVTHQLQVCSSVFFRMQPKTFLSQEYLNCLYYFLIFSGEIPADSNNCSKK